MTSVVIESGNGTVNKVGLEIPPIQKKQLTVRLIGDSPLITHAWAPKAIKEMLDRQTGEARQKKAPKNPEQDYYDSMYRLEGGGYGFPAVAFKSSAVTAAPGMTSRLWSADGSAARPNSRATAEIWRASSTSPVLSP